MKVKICGVTNLEDALAAVESGADMLGFNFYPPSPRFISPEQCQEMVAALREEGSTAAMVGVFVNASPEEMVSILDKCQLDLAQCSGDEPLETLQKLDGRALKALRPTSAAHLQDLLRLYPPAVSPPAYLIDAYRPGEYGGTGVSADWRLAHGLAERHPILLAGGLRPDNVAQALCQVCPWGVDVASGVESSPGKKDHCKIKAFIQAVRQFQQERFECHT